MEPRQPPGAREGGITHQVLIGAFGYAFSNFKLWFLWGLPVFLFLFFFDFLTEGKFDVGAVMRPGEGGERPPDPLDTDPGLEAPASPGIDTLLLLLLSHFVSLVAIAPLQLMVQRHILLQGERPDRPYLRTFNKVLVWRYVWVLLVKWMLLGAMGVVLGKVIASSVGFPSAAPAGTGLEVNTPVAFLGFAGLGLIMFVALRLDLAPPLCATGSRHPFWQSWRIMRGWVLKLMLTYLGFTIMMFVGVSVLFGVFGLIVGENPPLIAFLVGTIVGFFTAIVTAALTGKFLAYARPEDRASRVTEHPTPPPVDEEEDDAERTRRLAHGARPPNTRGQGDED